MQQCSEILFTSFHRQHSWQLKLHFCHWGSGLSLLLAMVWRLWSAVLIEILIISLQIPLSPCSFTSGRLGGVVWGWVGRRICWLGGTNWMFYDDLSFMAILVTLYFKVNTLANNRCQIVCIGDLWDVLNKLNHLLDVHYSQMFCSLPIQLLLLTYS